MWTLDDGLQMMASFSRTNWTEPSWLTGGSNGTASLALSVSLSPSLPLLFLLSVSISLHPQPPQLQLLWKGLIGLKAGKENMDLVGKKKRKRLVAAQKSGLWPE